MADKYLMALDAGSGAGRCFLISVDGRRSFSAYREWSYTTPPGGGAMASALDPDAFWQTLAEVSREAMQKAGIRGDQVAAVSSTSQREGCVFLDTEGEEIYAGPNRDLRAAFEGMQIAGTYGQELYRRTGHYPSGIFALARLLWHKNHAPAVFERIAHLLMLNDWILYKLSGQVGCEPSNGGETCAYDLGKHTWAADVIDQLDLPRHIFPPVLNSGTLLGGVTKQAAEETGLVPGTPVVVGGADTQCGLLGCGTIHPNEMAAISGTTTPVQMVTAEPVIDPMERLWAGAHVVPDRFVLESNAGGTGSVYQWYRDAFCQEEVDRAKTDGRSAYELMNERAQRVPPGSGGVRAYIGVMVFNAKTIAMPPSAILMGMASLAATGPACKDMLTRAIVESLAFIVKANADQIAEVAGVRPRCLDVTGGLSNSRLYLDVLANVMQLPLRVPCWREGSAVGAAICAGVGGGTFKDLPEGVAALVRYEPEVTPEARPSRQYQSIYRKWLQGRAALASSPAIT